jgi:hypothetical protein
MLVAVKQSQEMLFLGLREWADCGEPVDILDVLALRGVHRAGLLHGHNNPLLIAWCESMPSASAFQKNHRPDRHILHEGHSVNLTTPN